MAGLNLLIPKTYPMTPKIMFLGGLELESYGTFYEMATILVAIFNFNMTK